MTSTPAFLVDFQDAADVAGKRRTLAGWSGGVLRATLHRNRLELMNEADSTRCRRILSGSILIRCELARRQADFAPGDHAVTVPEPPIRKKTPGV